MEGLLIGANIALACKRGFARIEVGRNSLALLLINLVHFGWKLMTEADKCVRISVSNFISKPSHNCFNVRWTRISINSLRINGPFSLDVPEIVPLGTKKELMFTLISPQGRRMTWKVCFHEFLVGVGAVRLRKVLFVYHVLISFEEFPLVDGQSC